MRAGIALGSNLDERLNHLRLARDRIIGLPGADEPVALSSVYQTAPVECPPGTPDFLNAVMEISYDGAAEDLLRELRQIEGELGREETRARNQSRTIDLDLLYFGDQVREGEEIELPHPRLAERRFVLEPLAEIRPELILPGQEETVARLLEKLPAEPVVVRAPAQW